MTTTKPQTVRVIWKLEGHTVRQIVAKGAHVQDAFTRLSPRDRALITVFGVSTRTEPANTKRTP